MSKFDVSAIKTVKGVLKIFQAFINLFGAVFCLASIYSTSTFISQIRFFEFVSITGFILDLLLLAMDLVKIYPKIKSMPYIEMALDGLWILFYLIAANIIIKWVRWDGLLGVAVFCGYVAMITYFCDALLVYKKLQITNSSSFYDFYDL